MRPAPTFVSSPCGPDARPSLSTGGERHGTSTLRSASPAGVQGKAWGVEGERAPRGGMGFPVERSPLAVRAQHNQPAAAPIAAERDATRLQRPGMRTVALPHASQEPQRQQPQRQEPPRQEPPRHPQQVAETVEEGRSPVGRSVERAQRTLAREMKPSKPPFAGTHYDMAGRVTLGAPWLLPRCVAPQSRCEALSSLGLP
jgi:hypothetical protein